MKKSEEIAQQFEKDWHNGAGIEYTEAEATVLARFLRERGQAVPPEVASVLAKIEAALPGN